MNVKHYPRVSSQKQAKQGDSIESQDVRLRRDSEDNGDVVIGVYTDSGKSASISDDDIEISHKDGFVYAKIDIRKRVGMNEILDSLHKKDWDALKITKWDRFSRNNMFSKLMQIYFARKKKKIIAIDDSDDPLMIEIKGVLGEEEIRKMKGRVKDVRKVRFDKGLFPARTPIGYKPIIKDKKIVGFRVDPKKSEMVKDMFDMTSKGIKYKAICDKWKVSPQTYYNIIRNKIYIGIIEFEGNTKSGDYEPLINVELFEKINGK